MNEAELTALFAKLGARNPEGWARSQVREGIPQLARYVFLRQAWREIVAENDVGWIDNVLKNAERSPDAPYSGVGHALKRLRNLGASDEDLTDIVRGTQAEFLFSLCRLLDDPGDLEEEISDISWALVELDEGGNMLHQIGGLYESVLQTDPTGHEVRPRGRRA